MGVRISLKDGHEYDLQNGVQSTIVSAVNALSHSAGLVALTLDNGESVALAADTIKAVETLTAGSLPDREEPGLAGR
jgi:hypothetical protein